MPFFSCHRFYLTNIISSAGFLLLQAPAIHLSFFEGNDSSCRIELFHSESKNPQQSTAGCVQIGNSIIVEQNGGHRMPMSTLCRNGPVRAGLLRSFGRRIRSRVGLPMFESCFNGAIGIRFINSAVLYDGAQLQDPALCASVMCADRPAHRRADPAALLRRYQSRNATRYVMAFAHLNHSWHAK